jgi:microcystin-dependent protein
MLFALPDIRGRTIVGASRDTTIASPHEAGQSYGKEEIILKPENIPPHTHKWQFREAKITGTLRASTSIGNSASPENRIPAARPSSGPASKQMPVYGTLTNTRLNLSAVTLFTDPATDRTEKTGSANPAPISLRPLQTGLLACIKIAGEYPNRY